MTELSNPAADEARINHAAEAIRGMTNDMVEELPVRPWVADTVRKLTIQAVACDSFPARRDHRPQAGIIRTARACCPRPKTSEAKGNRQTRSHVNFHDLSGHAFAACGALDRRRPTFCDGGP